ncbi:iron ABC transporter permease [Agrobacterium rhizogenes]|uniref:Hemin transport system n=1 Tax=Rhizobium rhizogenes (strain K84 / ATCC BAA-868) TaxID=311403 RepID=B9JJ38_RHIR8|nr:hemin transport system [Rhizobium rhizogenes K84]NTI44898.1 iron ABC transporter permease [Rhizobium rhizogenes]NTI64978.1 iron ABC transporter permease [Rhizobium rhizogenes]OCJ19902.1 ABC transporter permease [Agrobacterium sp. B131/95]
MSRDVFSPRSPRVAIAILTAMLVIVAIGSLGVGRYDISFARVVQILLAPVFPPEMPVTPTEANVVFTVRLPRILLALLSGAGLALSGATLQGVFRNPLVGPQVMGVSSGAAFGGTLAILLSFSRAGLLATSFAFGLSALVLVYALNGIVARRNILALVLAGVVISGFFGALVSLVQYVADTEDKLPAMVFWLLGSFATANWEKLTLVAGPVLVGSILLLGLRWRINLLSIGDEEARALGVRVEPLRWLILILVSTIVAAQVAVSGIIGWVGLIVPHIARMLVGSDHRAMMPASLIIGALYLLVIDDIARTATGTEIPLGILTALIGTPIFVLVLWQTQRGIRGI